MKKGEVRWKKSTEPEGDGGVRKRGENKAAIQHEGKIIFPVDDECYNLLRQWITFYGT